MNPSTTHGSQQQPFTSVIEDGGNFHLASQCFLSPSQQAHFDKASSQVGEIYHRERRLRVDSSQQPARKWTLLATAWAWKWIPPQASLQINPQSWSNLQLCSISFSTHSAIQSGTTVKNLPDNARDVGSIPGTEGSPRGGNGKLLQYSWLEHSMEREAWRALVRGITKEVDTTEHMTYTGGGIVSLTCPYTWIILILLKGNVVVSFFCVVNLPQNSLEQHTSQGFL